MSSPEDQAEELLETWVNGNRKDVMRALGQMSQMRASYVAAFIAVQLNNLEEVQLGGVHPFLSMMRGRLE